MKKFGEFLERAEKILGRLDYVIYYVWPVIRDKRLLLKVLSELRNAILDCVGCVLHYEYLQKNIFLTKNPKKNFQIFVSCAGNYGITSGEVDLMRKLLNVFDKHNASDFEFVRNDKIIILSKNLETEVVTIEKIKIFFIMAQNVLKKTKFKFLSKI